MLDAGQLIAFAATTDMARATEFYEQVLGLALVEQNDFAAVFDANGTMLRVTAVPARAAAEYTVLGWRVADIDTAIAELAARGVQFKVYEGMGQSEAGVWTAPGGDKVAWFTDPDGNVLSLTQFIVR